MRRSWYLPFVLALSLLGVASAQLSAPGPPTATPKAASLAAPPRAAAPTAPVPGSPAAPPRAAAPAPGPPVPGSPAAGPPAAPQNRAIGVVAIRPPGADKPVTLYQASYALVIGVSNYADLGAGMGWPDLPGVRKDVAEVSKALEAQGFAVTLVADPNSEGLRKAFQDFINQRGLDPQNRLLFYFAGHGHTMQQAWGGDMGYIVPADTPNPNRDRDGFLTKALDMQQIEVYAKRIQSKHALFLFDSCFSGSLFDMTRAVPGVISYKTTKPVRQFITAGEANETVPDRSVFREQFVDGIGGTADSDHDGYITCTELGEYLQKTVVNYSKQTQHPQYGKIRDKNLDQGDFVFQLPSASPAPAGPVPLPDTKILDDILKKAGQDEETRRKAEAELLATAKKYYDALTSQYEASQPRDRAEARKRAEAYSVYAQQFDASGYQIAEARRRASNYEKWSAPGKEEASTSLQPDQIEILDLGDKVRLEMVFIPGGSFKMGSPESAMGAGSDEVPAHDVQLDGFWMGRCEVTNAQYARFANDSAYYGMAEAGTDYLKHFQGKSDMSRDDKYPVVWVSWLNAKAFCLWASRKTGWQFRLPTEAEWEYACRAGDQTGFTFDDADDDLKQIAWHKGNSGERTHPVGEKKQNAWGLYDMYGNVREWCEDWYAKDSYRGSPPRNPQGPSSGYNRVLRGGSWLYGPQYCRATVRDKAYPSSTYNNLGFRVVGSPPPR